MKKTIVPAIIAESQRELNERIERVRNHVSLVQLDVMDGRFVPSSSLDFEMLLPDNLNFEAHLMVQEPEEWIERNCNKVNTILVHVESCEEPGRVIQLVKGKKRIGFVLNPETPLTSVTPYLDRIDQVLVMTVNPGFYGSPFLPEMLSKVSELRRLKPALDIEVDGGVNAKTIRQVNDAGANMFVSGSYIVKAENVEEAVETLRRLVGGAE
jgi:ribulose-phosphate 3-epimerase